MSKSPVSDTQDIQADSDLSELFVRLRATDVSAEELALHRQRLERDTAYRQAFARLNQQWQELDGLQSWGRAELARLEQHRRPQPPWSVLGLRWGMVSAAAIVLVALFVTTLWRQQPEAVQYSTAVGEQRRLVLSDGSRVHLNSASSIKVKFSGLVREIQLDYGEGLFEVAHEKNRPFMVRVRNRKVIAVGTSFNVHYERGEIAVTVVEGRVALVQQDAAIDTAGDLFNRDEVPAGANGGTEDPTSTELSVFLEPGDQITLDKAGKVMPQRSVDTHKVTAWNRGLIVLDAMPLREVAREISRYTAAKIIVADSVPNYPVTGVIKITDQGSMLENLSHVVPVTAVKQSSQVTMLYPSN